MNPLKYNWVIKIERCLISVDAPYVITGIKIANIINEKYHLGCKLQPVTYRYDNA